MSGEIERFIEFYKGSGLTNLSPDAAYAELARLRVIETEYESVIQDDQERARAHDRTDTATQTVTMYEVICGWLAENNPAALEMCPFKVVRSPTLRLLLTEDQVNQIIEWADDACVGAGELHDSEWEIVKILKAIRGYD